jgi:hypothetical protein
MRAFTLQGMKEAVYKESLAIALDWRKNRVVTKHD